MLGSFSGILMIGFSAPNLLDLSNNHGYLLGVMCSVASAMCLSFIYVATSKMRQVHYLQISFYLGALTGIISILGIVG